MHNEHTTRTVELASLRSGNDASEFALRIGRMRAHTPLAHQSARDSVSKRPRTAHVTHAGNENDVRRAHTHAHRHCTPIHARTRNWLR